MGFVVHVSFKTSGRWSPLWEGCGISWKVTGSDWPLVCSCSSSLVTFHWQVLWWPRVACWYPGCIPFPPVFHLLGPFPETSGLGEQLWWSSLYSSSCLCCHGCKYPWELVPGPTSRIPRSVDAHIPSSDIVFAHKPVYIPPHIFLFLYICIFVHVCVCMGAHVWASVHTGPGLSAQVFLYHRGRVSQLNLELTVSSSRLASQPSRQ